MEETMGCVFQPRYKGKDGTLRVSSIWWMKYRNAAGVVVREASGTDKKRAAEKLLDKRTGAAADGRPTSPHTEKVTVDELLTDLENEYEANARGVARLRYSLAHVRPAFGLRRAGLVSTADINAYIVARQHQRCPPSCSSSPCRSRSHAPAANGTINRELAALKRAYALATQATPPKLYLRPDIPMLTEDNVRSGFFEWAQLHAVLAHLPEALRALMIVAYVTGWRMADELFPMRWAQVDFRAGTLSLAPGTTKNKDGRLFPFTPELRAVLEAQREVTERLQREKGAIIPYVFHRQGKPIKDLHKVWRKACVEAGCPGRIPTTFAGRRSATSSARACHVRSQ
jgi:integrase